MDKQIEKKKVTIIQVDEPKSGTSKNTGKPYTIYSFKAKNGDGKEVTYKTMSKSIGEKLSHELQCEIEFETSSRQVGDNTYTDHNVSQMWINGNPIRDTEKKGWTPKADNPEQRSSIEKQVLWKGYVDTLIVGKSLPEDIEHGILSWARNALGIGDKPKPKQSPNGDQPGDIAVPAMPKVSDFWNVCYKEFGLKAAEVREELNKYGWDLGTTGIPVDLKEAYLKLLEARR